MVVGDTAAAFKVVDSACVEALPSKPPEVFFGPAEAGGSVVGSQ